MVFLQETNFSDNEWRSFKVAFRNGFHAFFSGIVGRSGGAAALVKTQLPVRPAWSCKGAGGAACAVWIEGKFFTSIYFAPNQDSHDIFCQTVEKLQAVPQAQWILGGDFNATPDENPFQHVMARLEFGTTGESTRWEGHRNVDYFLSNQPLEIPTLQDIKLADLKVVSMLLPSSLKRESGFEISPCVRLPPFQGHKSLWEATLTRVWNSERASLPEQWSGNIDADWELLSSSFSNALAKTQFTLDPESIRKITAALLRRGKPTRVSTRRVEILMRLKAGHLATFQECSLSNLVARLKEAQRYLDHPQAESLASSKDVQKLWARIQRSPHYDPTQGIQRNLLRVERQLQQCISSADAQRLARWKDKMQDDKEALLSGYVEIKRLLSTLSKCPMNKPREPQFKTAWVNFAASGKTSGIVQFLTSIHSGMTTSARLQPNLFNMIGLIFKLTKSNKPSNAFVAVLLALMVGLLTSWRVSLMTCSPH